MHTGCSRNGACCAILQFLEGEKREKRVPLTLQDMLLQARVLMDRRQGRLPLPLLHPVLLTLLVLPPLPYQHNPLLLPPPLLVWLVVKTFFFHFDRTSPKIEVQIPVGFYFIAAHRHHRKTSSRLPAPLPPACTRAYLRSTSFPACSVITLF